MAEQVREKMAALEEFLVELEEKAARARRAASSRAAGSAAR
jgi:hypothetical protein